MESTSLQITLPTVGKSDIKSASENIISQVCDNGTINPLEAMVMLKAYSKVIEDALKGIQSATFAECDKYPTNTFDAYGVQVQKKGTTKYDFTVCNCPELESAEAKVKEIKEALKVASETRPYISSETGEMFTVPAAKIQSESISILFK